MMSTVAPTSDETRTSLPAETRQSHVPLFVGLALVALFSVVLYWSTTGIGFLLDDLIRPWQIFMALHGQPQMLLQFVFSGGLASTCALTSFRPGTELTFVLDYLAWGGNGFGYHLTNIFSYAINCIFVGLICFELAGWFHVKHRTPASLAAALLFACYPLHVESTAWIIGRVDVLCTMFYLASVYCYLVYLRSAGLRPPVHLALSYTFFLAALCSKEMAVSLPVVAWGANVLFAKTQAGSRRSSAEAVRWTGAMPVLGFFGILAAFAVVRTLLLHTVVGGYGTLDKHTFRQVMRNIRDLPTWSKVVFPVTDESVRNWAAFLPTLKFSAYAGLAATIGAAVMTLVRKRPLLPLFAFLLGWFLIALLPTFQIFHVFPNLVGSRLFFLSSAPMCMLAGFSFICAAETMAKSRAALAIAGACIVAIVTQWVVLLQINLEPWLQAGRRMSFATTLVQKVAAATAPGDKVLFANLPADYKGAGLIGRPEYLTYMLKPPLCSQDFSDRVDTCERPVPGPNAFVFPSQFERQVSGARETYIWNEPVAAFTKWKMPGGMRSFALSDQRSVANADANGTRWFIPQASRPRSSVAAGASPLAEPAVNPLGVRAIQVKFAEPVKTLGPITLIWSAPTIEWWQAIIQPVFADEHTITFVPSRLRVWTFAPSIDAVGLQGGGIGHLLSARSIDVSTIEPRIQANGTTIKVDGSSIPGCHSVRIFVAKQGQSFSDFATTSAPDSALVQSSFKLPDSHGQITVPATALRDSVHAACAQAFDSHDHPIGILSEVVAISR